MKFWNKVKKILNKIGEIIFNKLNKIVINKEKVIFERDSVVEEYFRVMRLLQEIYRNPNFINHLCKTDRELCIDMAQDQIKYCNDKRYSEDEPFKTLFSLRDFMKNQKEEVRKDD